MDIDDIRVGWDLYPVARTLVAPSICYRSTPVQVTVVALAGLGDLVDVTEPDGTPHRMHAADLTRTPPSFTRSITRKPPRSMAVSDGPWEEIALW